MLGTETSISSQSYHGTPFVSVVPTGEQQERENRDECEMERSVDERPRRPEARGIDVIDAGDDGDGTSPDIEHFRSVFVSCSFPIRLIRVGPCRLFRS